MRLNMECPWLKQNVFYICAPGFVAPCCFFPFVKMLDVPEHKAFQKRYKMLYLKNNALENILADTTLLKQLIQELIDTGYCKKYCGGSYAL